MHLELINCYFCLLLKNSKFLILKETVACFQTLTRVHEPINFSNRTSRRYRIQSSEDAAESEKVCLRLQPSAKIPIRICGNGNRNWRTMRLLSAGWQSDASHLIGFSLNCMSVSPRPRNIYRLSLFPKRRTYLYALLKCVAVFTWAFPIRLPAL